MNLPSPIFILIYDGRTRALYSPDIETTRDALVRDLADDAIAPPVEIYEWRPDEPAAPVKVTADIAAMVWGVLDLHGDGCRSWPLRCWLDDNLGAGKADKLRAMEVV